MYSQKFDDIYFSREDGLAESRHTYLAGNNLPQAWSGRNNFHILELGFGSGLNFLATCKLWQETAQENIEPEQRLHYTAIEKFPLVRAEIKDGLAHWQDEIGMQLGALQAVYPDRLEGRHSLQVSDRITLELFCMDVNDALPQVQLQADACYLDGFAPAKNPAMWSPDVFHQLARLSQAGSTFATFTVAAVVRNGAQASGFAVWKTPGYGRKREMLVGEYKAI